MNDSKSGPPRKIVLIDDDADILETIGSVLQDAGFEVHTALHGDEGLSLIRAVKPDLIICDLMMETVDAGIQIAERARDISASIPFYLLSSVGDATDDNLNVRRLGIAGTIQKPIAPENLVALIKNALRMK